MERCDLHKGVCQEAKCLQLEVLLRFEALLLASLLSDIIHTLNSVHIGIFARPFSIKYALSKRCSATAQNCALIIIFVGCSVGVSTALTLLFK